MFKKALFTLLVFVAVSQGALRELLPGLTSEDLEIQTRTRLELLAVCSDAGRPGNEAQRYAVCVEICTILSEDQPTGTVVQPLVNNLERIGGEESVPTLVKLLAHKDEHIRDDARRALSVNPSPDAAQALGAQLKMRKARSATSTAGFIYALGERRQAGASNLITGFLSSRDQEVFMAAVKTLGTLGEDAGVEALFAQRRREKGFRRMQVTAALFVTERGDVFKKLYEKSEPPRVRATALLGLILQGDSGLAAEAMASGDAALQLAVIEAALQAQDPRVCDAVVENVGGLPPHIQLQALGALAFCGNRAYAAEVEKVLQSTDSAVQDQASRALARIGTVESVGPLLANNRAEAQRALGMLDADGVDKMLEETAAGDDNESMRAAAIDALARRGRRDLIAVCFTYAEEEGRDVSTSAVKAIGHMGDMSCLEQLVRLMISKEEARLSRDILEAVVDITSRSADPAGAVDVLVRQMEGASPRSQANILQALVQTGSQEALSPVVDACRSADEALQKQAVKLLSGWPHENGLPVMIELASDQSMSLANHVTLMRGISRLLAGQEKFNAELADEALDACRRADEKQMIRDVIETRDV